jgi:hypothetical protein
VRLSRRAFLGGTGAAMVAAACSSGGDGTDSPADPDLDTAEMCAGLEKMAADTYFATSTQIVQGRLGAAVPAALAELINTAVRHHLACLDAWNEVLAAGQRLAVTDPDARLRPLVDAAMARSVDIPGAAAVTLRMEDYLAQTYLKAMPTLATPDAITLAARMLVVDQKRIAVLRYILGLDPVGHDFAPANPNW